MTRKTLTGAICKVAHGCGYAFYTGPEYRINNELKELPALWLAPAELTAREGRLEGIETYEVTIKLMSDVKSNSSASKDEVWDGMVDIFTCICSALREEDAVRHVYNVKYSPAEFSLTNKGELSLAVSFKVDMQF